VVIGSVSRSGGGEKLSLMRTSHKTGDFLMRTSVMGPFFAGDSSP
jgi:hypothetical protein